MEDEEPIPSKRGLHKGRTTQRERPRRLTQRELETLIQQTPGEILLRLSSHNGGLQELVSDESISDDCMVLVMRAISKSFTREMRDLKQELLKDITNIFLGSNFLNDTLYSLLKSHIQEKISDDSKDLLMGTLMLICCSMDYSPRIARPKVIHLGDFLSSKMNELKDGFTEEESITFTKELEALNIMMVYFDPRKRNKTGQQPNPKMHGADITADDEQPGENFRALPLIPTQLELTTQDNLILRRNRESGRFTNLEQYLDIQFRLFRADFILPLRESIEKYIGHHEAETEAVARRRIRLYHDVQIIRPVCTEKDVAYRISFDIGQIKSVDWRSTQRLKYGSLVCLSLDNFQNFICATVQNRELLPKGVLDVVFILELEELHHITEVSRDKRFLMVESPAYFEAYRYVLQGIKNLNDHNFPFIRYIVECNPDVTPPAYLQKGTATGYSFQSLTKDNFVIEEDNLLVDDVTGNVEVMNLETWPEKTDLHLDSSQYYALQRALTEEFAVIQGPPGTGKTYLGLKIARMLLHNSHAWNDPVRKRPLLVVCYTNHALDQFLEGILNFFKGSLVRVGARSKSEVLAGFSLTNFRTRARENRKVPQEIHEAKVNARLELNKMKLNIHKGASQLEIVEQEIVKESFLTDCICDKHLTMFKNAWKCREDSAMLKWLKLEKLCDRLVYQAEYGLKQLPPLAQLVKARGSDSQARDDDDKEEDDDDDDDFETVDVSDSLREDARMLDDDLDEDYDSDLDSSLDGSSEVEETQMEKYRRLQRELETEVNELKQIYVALDLSNFYENHHKIPTLRDRTLDRLHTSPQELKKKDKLVAENFNKLVKHTKHILQSKLRSTDFMTLDEAQLVENIWQLKPDQRWRLYRHWVDLYCRQKRGEIHQMEEDYHQKSRRYQIILNEEDLNILKNAGVIGMTTTGSARYQAVLQEIGPRIIIVEEAAEVFEAHVVATLSQECQHLILIGDHKQLRPSPVVYDLAKKCNLDISLFERMIRNQFKFECLQLQHRMRPEISRMMKITDLYPDLEDHDVVKHYEQVRGIKSSVAYINHSWPESKDQETSFSNEFEAEFLVALCSYLLKQGYRPGQITILSPYSGQIRKIGNLMPRDEFEGVRISSVDNFQGEENDIILLSLVRSNNEEQIGFLKTNNRICVAFSRAKIGFYVIGNFEVLRKGSPLLDKIIQKADEGRIYKDGLDLCCLIHAKNVLFVQTPKDFHRVPEGGCTEKCGVRLACGHSCERMCHPNMRDHEDVPCLSPCTRICPTCETRCEGGHSCFKHKQCTGGTPKFIVRCGHTQIIPCGVEANRFVCQEACDKVLACGHPCQERCGEPHTRHCQQIVKVTNNPCGHEHESKCCEKETSVCSEPCRLELLCGHICQGSCGACKQGRLHISCEERCKKILVCNHECQDKCCTCSPCTKTCANRCVHSHCDKPCGQRCIPCSSVCAWRCEHFKCTKLCGEDCDRERCDQRCSNILDCGHRCVGLCGEMCPPLCRTCDPEYFDDPVFGEPEPDALFVYLEDCNHVIEISSLDQWIRTSVQTTVEEGESRLIKLPECPQCKVPIRKNLRYGNVIKKYLKDLDAIKQLCLGNVARTDELIRKIDQAKSRVAVNLRPRVEDLVRGHIICESRLMAQLYQITLLTDVNHLLRQVEVAVAKWHNVADVYQLVKSDMEGLIEWCLKPRSVFGNQEFFDSKQEFERLRILLHLMNCQQVIYEDEHDGNLLQVEQRLVQRLAINVRTLRKTSPPSENDLEEGRKISTELKEKIPDPYSALSDEERAEIVKAVSVPSGQWYACARGHYYAIGECGRPMERGTCPECRSPIGGVNHAFAAANRWAPEMDNAEGPVWSLERDEEFARLLQQQEFDQWH